MFFNPALSLKSRFPLFILVLFCSSYLTAQECAAVKKFKAAQYNLKEATYQWSFAADAHSYKLSIDINGKSYLALELPGSTKSASIKFSPLLKHNDQVHAQITKYCMSGGEMTAAFDFIIIDDAVVYLTGSTTALPPTLVEPVNKLNDNLVPADTICGRCDPDYFRLEAGFYGPFGIAVDTAIGPIEQLRFLKSELCGCLDDAIASGILDVNGGPGPQYNGSPFRCQLTTYQFEELDCTRKNREERSLQPKEFNQHALHLQLIPNPASQFTQIQYRLSQETNTTLAIYDVAGRLVQTVVNHRTEPAGDYQIEFDASTLSPGFYYCLLLTAEGDATTTVLVVAPKNR
jgi:hypothetical protein